jgi:hypothetical protein
LFEDAWVLVTDHGFGQSRTSLAAVRALAAAGYRAAVTVTDEWSLAAASRHCGRVVRIAPNDDADYARAVQAEISRNRYVGCLPTSDRALLALGHPVAKWLDKQSLGPLAASVGLITPHTLVFGSAEELLRSAREIEYPAVIKPAHSTFRPYCAAGPDQLDGKIPSEGPLLVQPYITEGLSASSGIVWKGRLLAAVHQRYLRTWPPDCGGACAALTVAPDRGREARLLALLAGYDGIFMAQFAGPYLLDLNLRVYGSMPLAVAAGVNLASMYCALLRGRAPWTETRRGRLGVRYRWMEGELRYALRRGRPGAERVGAVWGALAPRPGIAVSTETWRDPGPGLLRMRYALRHRG